MNMLSEVNTSNYLSVALADDLVIDSPVIDSSEQPQLPLGDPKAARTAIREKRIAAAVERSRTEYKDEHAYTEREWLKNVSLDHLQQNSTLDAHKFEQIIVSLYYSYPPQYNAIVHAVLQAIDPKAKTLGGLTREVLDMGLTSAIACQDRPAALVLARLSSTMWGHQMAGLAANASDALAMAGYNKEALLPLLVSITAHGLHVPLLIRMTDLLGKIRRDARHQDCQALDHLVSRVDHIVGRRQSSFDRPLFPDRPLPHRRPASAHSPSEALPDGPIDGESLQALLELDRAGMLALQGTLQRLEKGLRGSESQADEPRGVREL